MFNCKYVPGKMCCTYVKLSECMYEYTATCSQRTKFVCVSVPASFLSLFLCVSTCVLRNLIEATCAIY